MKGQYREIEKSIDMGWVGCNAYLLPIRSESGPQHSGWIERENESFSGIRYFSAPGIVPMLTAAPMARIYKAIVALIVY